MMNIRSFIKYCGFLILLIASTYSFAQKEEVLPINIDDYKFVKPGDTLVIQLEEITLLPRPKFQAREDIRYYLWLKRKVFKSYPYAKLASQRLDSLNNRLAKIKSKRKQKRYVKQIQNYVEGEFTEQIKKMTRTEGRLLIKLVHRQTGKTAFDHIKKYRSGWKAFWYNSTANLFSLSLKTEYNPEAVNEDFLVEDILQRAFRDEKLEKQDTKLNFDYLKIITKNKSKVNVDEYKLMFEKIKKKKKKN